MADPFFFLPSLPTTKPALVIFDEIHKRPQWKNILKGMFDTTDPAIRFLITGSARLEWFRKSGELLGRALFSFSYDAGFLLRDRGRTWPTCGYRAEWKNPWSSRERFMGKRARCIPFRGTFSIARAFLEPLTRGSEPVLCKWKTDYLSLILREDLRDITNIKAI